MRNVQLFCIACCSRSSSKPVRIQKRVQVEKLPTSSLATLFDPRKPLTTQLQCISWLSCQPGSAVTNTVTVFHTPCYFHSLFLVTVSENLDVYQSMFSVYMCVLSLVKHLPTLQLFNTMYVLKKNKNPSNAVITEIHCACIHFGFYL